MWTKVCSAPKPTLASTPCLDTWVPVPFPSCLRLAAWLARPAPPVNWERLMGQSNDKGTMVIMVIVPVLELSQCAGHDAKQFALTTNLLLKTTLQYRYHIISISQKRKLRIYDYPRSASRSQSQVCLAPKFKLFDLKQLCWQLPEKPPEKILSNWHT